MSYKTLSWLFVALVCGTIAAFVFKQLFYSSSPKKEELQAVSKRSVLVAKVDLKAGTELSAQNVRFDLIPEDQIPRDAIYSFEGISKQKVVNNINKGSVIRNLYDLEYVKEHSEDPEYHPPGYSVVPIQIESVFESSDQRNIADLIPLDKVVVKNDCVDLYVIAEESSSNAFESLKKANRRLIDKLLVENAVIIDVMSEKRFNKDNDLPKRYSVVSVLLKDEQKNIVEEEASRGKLRLVIKKKEANSGEQFSKPLHSTLTFLNDSAVVLSEQQLSQSDKFDNESMAQNNNSFLSDEFKLSESTPVILSDKIEKQSLLTQPQSKQIDRFSQSDSPNNFLNKRNDNIIDELDKDSVSSELNNTDNYYQYSQNKTAGQDLLPNNHQLDLMTSRPLLPYSTNKPVASQERIPVSSEKTQDLNPPSLQPEKSNDKTPIFRSRQSSSNHLTQSLR